MTRSPWAAVSVGLGVGYALVGILFALPGTHVQAWRLAAWALSALGFGAHIAYERFRLRNRPMSAALHIAAAVAIGGFGLAVGANIHSLAVASPIQHRQLLRWSLLIWPVITAAPAFVVALALNLALVRLFARSGGR